MKPKNEQTPDLDDKAPKAAQAEDPTIVKTGDEDKDKKDKKDDNNDTPKPKPGTPKYESLASALQGLGDLIMQMKNSIRLGFDTCSTLCSVAKTSASVVKKVGSVVLNAFLPTPTQPTIKPDSITPSRPEPKGKPDKDKDNDDQTRHTM